MCRDTRPDDRESWPSPWREGLAVALARYQGLRLNPPIAHVTRSELKTAACLAHASKRVPQ
jgi:hypothetical protein